jgi:hypothetical protein
LLLAGIICADAGDSMAVTHHNRMTRAVQCSTPGREPDFAGYDLVGGVSVDFMLAYFLWCVSQAEYSNVSPSALSPGRLGMGIEDVTGVMQACF